MQSLEFLDRHSRDPGISADLITIIDVDEATWRSHKWGNGEPYRAPRSQMAQLIHYAFDRGAQNVVVDVIVENPAINPEDKKFADNMGALASNLSKSHRHILFVRTIKEPLFAPDLLAPTLRASPLDKVISSSKGTIIDVAPYFEVSRDGVLRNWRLWSAGCQPDIFDALDNPSAFGKWKVLPSVQLTLATMNYQQSDLPWSQSGAFGLCRSSEAALGYATPPIRENEKSIDATMFKRLQKDQRLTRQHLDPETTVKFDPTSRILFADRFPPSGARVQIAQALAVLCSHSPDTPDCRNARTPKAWGRTVIIGQSADAAHDAYETPLGNMPGYMVLANSIRSLDKVGVIAPFGAPFEEILTIISIVVVGFAFARFDSLFGTILVGLPFAIALIALSFLLLRSGYWLDFSVPLIGIYLHKLVRGAEDYVSNRRYAEIERGS